MKSLISVIVPIYNVEKYIRKCIDSIISQTYKNLEIILVDDGSPDNCGKICDEYAKNDARIKVIHKENGGLSDARNAGIEAANGEYLAFIDSDDYISFYMIEKLYERIIKDNSDVAVCSFKFVEENGRELPERENVSPIRNEILTGTEALSRLVFGKTYYYVVAWNKLYKRDIFEKIRFPKGKIHEDEFVIHHIFDMCKKVSFLEELLYNYVQRENSIISSSNKLKRLDVVEAMYDRVLFATERKLNNLAYSALSGMARRIAAFIPFDKMSEQRKEELYFLYLAANRMLNLKGLSFKRKVIVGINKLYPQFLLYKHTKR